MKKHPDFRELSCKECAGGADLGFEFTMAFQPIVKSSTRSIFAHEALVRGLNNESAGEVFKNVNPQNLYRFDQACRVKAIKLAAELNIQEFVSINFMPNAVYKPELCIRATLAAAREYGYPIERIIFEITESERVEDLPHLKHIIEYYQLQGFMTAIDDFGAGYSGLNLLADISTDLIKLDIALIRNIDTDIKRQAIVKGVLEFSKALGSTIIAEGVETRAEFEALQKLGVDLFQGFYFARPSFESLADINWD